jgi:hypothetical protein
MNQIPRKSLYTLLLIYFLSNAFLLVNNGIYWDDWTLTNMSLDQLKAQFLDNGGYYIGLAHLHWFLNTFFSYPPVVYRFLVFFSGMGTAIFFYRSLLSLRVGEDNIFPFYAACIWAAIPFNLAKVSMICVTYNIALFFFAIALYLFIDSLQNQRRLSVIVSCILFLCSFTTNSLVLLYSIIIPIYFYVKRDFSFTQIRNMFRTIPHYLVLPFIFAACKATFYHPSSSGLHDEVGYYTITLSKLLEIPTNFIYTFIESNLGLINVFYDTVFQSVILLVSFLILAFLLSRKLKGYQPVAAGRNIVFIGIALFTLAVLAYLLIGKVPHYNNFDSRHQLLLGFGVAFILYWTITNFTQNNSQPLLFGIAIAALITTSMGGQINLLRDWMKQESIKTNFETVSLDTLNGPIVLVEDHTIPYNYDQVSYEFYVWNGMYKATGKSTNKSFIAIERLREPNVPYCEQAFHYFNKKHLIDIEYLNLKDFHPAMECSTMKVDKGVKKLVSIPEVLKLVALYYSNREDFHNRIGGYTAVSFSTTAPEL